MSIRTRSAAPLTRRTFLGTGLTVAASSVAGAAQVAPVRATSCVFLFLTGGPSHLDTWDPKPDAPAEVRGPFGSIATSVPGIRIGEHFPRMAALAHRYAIVRSVHHDATPIHETGQQLLQTGRLSPLDGEHPHIGAVLAQRLGPRAPGAPAFVVMPRLIADTGVNVYHGQGAAFLGAALAPVVLEANHAPSDTYGRTAFGAQCLRARQLVEAGTRMVVVNMCTSLADGVTWDCHADRRLLRSSLDDYRRTLCPTFDRGYAALLDDLRERCLLDTTLVVAAGEFGRTPRLNARGGRDHWPGVWSVLFAGGGVRGGQIIGASDKHAAAPARRPVRAVDVPATVYQAFGLDPALRLTGPHGEKVPLTEGRPIAELFA